MAAFIFAAPLLGVLVRDDGTIVMPACTVLPAGLDGPLVVELIVKVVVAMTR